MRTYFNHIVSVTPLIIFLSHETIAFKTKARPNVAWTPEKSREVADAWLEEQRRLGLATRVGPGSTIFGSDVEEFELQGLNPKETFERSEIAEFPESELGRAAKNLRFDDENGSSPRPKASSPNTQTGPSEKSSPEFVHINDLDQDTLRGAREESNRVHRKARWSTAYYGDRYGDPYYNPNKVDVSQDIDWWAQGYRMLGGFIDCSQVADKHDRNDGDDDEKGCSRWMMWAAYYNPYYQGGGWNEYYGDYDDDYVNYANKTDDGNRHLSDGNDIDYEEFRKRLNCHKPNTKWVLIGVYRQEFYQFIEQLSKHLWGITSYEYITAISGLAYMTDEDCSYIGQDNSNNKLYSGPRPLSSGKFMIGVYTDNRCLVPTDDYNYDDFNLTSSLSFGGSQDGDDDVYVDETLYMWWTYGQEQTLTNLNQIMNTFKMCRLCLDYPTYQDGYFIGDTGTDDGSIINQCWKFHSHDSFPCNADCILLGHEQGTILPIAYGTTIFGGGGSSEVGGEELSFVSSFQKIEANVFFVFSSIIFLAACISVYATVSTPEPAQHKHKRSSMLKFAKKRLLRNKKKTHPALISIEEKDKDPVKNDNNSIVGDDTSSLPSTVDPETKGDNYIPPSIPSKNVDASNLLITTEPEPEKDNSALPSIT